LEWIYPILVNNCISPNTFLLACLIPTLYRLFSQGSIVPSHQKIWQYNSNSYTFIIANTVAMSICVTI